MANMHNLPAPVETTSNPKDGKWDGVVLVCENLDWKCEPIEFLKDPIKAAQKVDKSAGSDVLLFPLSEGPPFVIHAPTGPVNRDYDDVRRYADAAVKGIQRAIKAGSKAPLLVIPPTSSFSDAWPATVLGAFHGLYVPLEIREDVPSKKQKVEKLGVFLHGTELNIDYVSAVESGRLVCRDIGGSDPERMAAPNVETYVRKTFKGTPVKISVLADESAFETDYPLLAAVNRCAKHVKRHQGRLIQLEYVGEGKIDQTLLLVGKGITYDTGGADIKAGGVMAGMHRDKCGAAAVAGFFQILAKLKPKGIKVLGKMAMVRNSVGSDCYVADEIITSAAGVRVRVGNTDAEGRMVMADPLHHSKLEALKEKNPHVITIATLTGHAIRAMGPNYSIVLDNGPAAKKSFAQKIQAAGHEIGDPFEISTIRRDDYEFAQGKSEYEDVLQCNNTPSSGTARGHQFPAAFLIRASGLDKHGIDSKEPICFSHMDIAGSSGPFPGIPTGAPIVAMAEYFLKNRI
ncbi:putative aminopeptidase W07G4.4 [Actinia tenebrosa]|uniref:Aminopeptidase W07G4.4 n=1 Tax=Actinia tenebrosa TaxID=6105 RepID=A0A6P8IMG4_ACTTE|nr:putative aminopeptidase W07G4.4 [Actinia tenebrosa]